MRPLTKTILTTSLIAVPALAAAETPTTQPAAQAATQPTLAQSNAPLVIPDGTSPQNPGPQFRSPQQYFDFNGLNGNPNQVFVVTGVRG